MTPIVTLTPVTKEGQPMGQVDFVLSNISFYVPRLVEGAVKVARLDGKKGARSLIQQGTEVTCGGVRIAVAEEFQVVRAKIADAIARAIAMHLDIEYQIKSGKPGGN